MISEDESAEQDSADEDELFKSTPTPKPKGKKSRKIKVEEKAVEGDDGDGEEGRVTPVSTKHDDADTDSQLHDYLEGSHFEAEMFAFD